MGIFDSLDIGRKSLAASQIALDVTGQNISNANTEGYSRKRVEISQDIRRSDGFGELGNGVVVDKVVRLRNEFIDVQVNNQTSLKGFSEKVDVALERVENIFTEPSDSSINGYMDNFWDSWQDLTNNPADFSARESVRVNTEVLTGQFHVVAGELRDYKLTINDEIADEVNEINAIANEILKFNDEIAIGELGEGLTANDSRDRRTVALRELAEKIKMEFIEDSNGRVTVTTEGTILVGPHSVNELELTAEVVRESDGFNYNRNEIRFSGSPIAYSPSSGELAGLFNVRDVQIDKYETEINSMAEALVTSVNELHSKGYDIENDTGIMFFDPDAITAIDIDLADSIKDDSKNIAAAQGGTLVQPAVNPLPGTVSATREIDVTDNTQNALYDSRYFNMAQGSVTITMGGVELEEGAGKDYNIDYAQGKIFFNNAGTVPTGSAVDISFQYNDSPFGGIGDGRNAGAIAKLKDSAQLIDDSEGNPTQTMQEFYSSFIGVLGIERNESASKLETQMHIIAQMDRRQAEVSGVSLDEEMANLIKFEKTYQAAARYISSVDEMIDVILNL